MAHVHNGSVVVNRQTFPASEANTRETQETKMQFNTETPRNEVTIQAQVFTVPAVYNEGHTLNANEAGALNQLLVENVRNNFAGKMKAEAEKPEGERKTYTQEDLDAYVASYEFGVRRSGGGAGESRLPPEEREARKIAREKVVEALKAKGIKVNSLSAEKMEEFVSKIAKTEDVVREANRRVKSAAKISLEELDLGGSDPVSEAA